MNLGLSIVGRKPDGYHLLESLFWPIDLCDEIRIQDGGRLAVETLWAEDAPFPEANLPSQEENLVFKALRKAFPRGEPGLSVRIKKRIPMGGGLGGGSSNAGTVLRFLVERRVLAAPDALRIATELGADVPYFLFPRPAWVTGVGEELRTLDVKVPLFFLLVLFPFPTSTPQVFARYRESGRPFSLSRPAPASLTAYLNVAHNDLEEMVAGQSPSISAALHALRATPCIRAGLSGSGSTCFAAYSEDALRKKSLKELTALFRKNNCRALAAETYA